MGGREGSFCYKQNEGKIFIFALRCCSSRFVTHQFQFHDSLTYLMVFRPPIHPLLFPSLAIPRIPLAWQEAGKFTTLGAFCVFKRNTLIYTTILCSVTLLKYVYYSGSAMTSARRVLILVCHLQMLYPRSTGVLGYFNYI